MNTFASNSFQREESLSQTTLSIENSIKSMRETMNHYIENHLYYNAVFYAEKVKHDQI